MFGSIIVMNRKKQQKRGNKKNQKKGRGKGRGKRIKQNKASNKQNAKSSKPSNSETRPKQMFKVDSISPSAAHRVELLVSGMARQFGMENPYNVSHLKIEKAIITMISKYAQNVFSILNTVQLSKVIQVLVERNLISDLKQHKLQYLLNAQCDGFDGETFHKLCDRKGPTLVVIKSNWDYIFGGFTKAQWKIPDGRKGEVEYERDSEAFVFSFYLGTDNLKIYPISFDRCNYAIENTKDRGPVFGYSDIVMSGKGCNEGMHSFCRKSCYKIAGGASTGNKLCGGNDQTLYKGYYRFQVENYEVFELK